MKKMNGNGSGVILLFLLFIVVASCWGWVSNLIDVINMSFDPLTGLAIAKAVGIIVVPLGVVMGWFT